jgi:lipoprotein-anchoring transpeptidase ErfK/SrfK
MATCKMAQYHRPAMELPRQVPRWVDMKHISCAATVVLLFTSASASAGDTSTASTTPAVDQQFGQLAETFADVRKDGADVFATVDDIKAGVPTAHVGDKTFVAIKPTAKSLTLDGIKYFRTDQGWIARTSLSWYSPSTFHGEQVAAAGVLPSWVFAHKAGGKLVVLDEPQKKAKVVRKISSREIVTVSEVRDGFARLNGAQEWIDARDVRTAQRVARPVGVEANERWIDIDLDQQILVSYVGDSPAFATLISTGKVKWETPAGVYRIVDKRERARMQADGPTEQWNVAAVPWTMTFRKNFALHGTYWHDGFGRARSHGCVNLAPADAHRLFEFVTAATPAKIQPPVLGTPVQLRRGKEQAPPWRDYQGKLMTLAPPA